MKQNVFLVKWYGPFTQEELQKWEEKQKFKCSIYLLHGMLKHAKTKESYYCGISTRSVHKRLCDKDHHINEIKDRLNSIYAGCISNVENPSSNSIRLIEKMITAYLADTIGRKSMLNLTNFKYPKQNVYVVNEWWKEDTEYLWQRQPKNAPSHILPDVLTYHYWDSNDIEMYECKKLKKVSEFR